MPEPQDTTAEIVSADEAIHSSNITMLDPAEMNRAEIEKALGRAAGCDFSYTRAGTPILSVREPALGASETLAVVKLNGELVLLHPERPFVPNEELAVAADGMRMIVTPLVDAEARRNPFLTANAQMIFELDEGLRVGYRGFYSCDAAPQEIASE